MESVPITTEHWKVCCLVTNKSERMLYNLATDYKLPSLHGDKLQNFLRLTAPSGSSNTTTYQTTPSPSSGTPTVPNYITAKSQSHSSPLTSFAYGPVWGQPQADREIEKIRHKSYQNPDHGDGIRPQNLYLNQLTWLSAREYFIRLWASSGTVTLFAWNDCGESW